MKLVYWIPIIGAFIILVDTQNKWLELSIYEGRIIDGIMATWCAIYHGVLLFALIQLI